jgi:hypothetical protein
MSNDFAKRQEEYTISLVDQGRPVAFSFEDAFELVTRAVTEGRYAVDPALALPERGLALERFVFRLGHRDRAVTLVLREGYVTEEFIALTRRDDRTPEDERRLGRWKLEMAERVMAAPAPEVYSVID